MFDGSCVILPPRVYFDSRIKCLPLLMPSIHYGTAQNMAVYVSMNQTAFQQIVLCRPPDKSPFYIAVLKAACSS